VILGPKEFCAILDREGCVVDTVVIHDDVIWATVRHLDAEDPESAPHSPWIWSGSEWRAWK
jgi:hypothetical protein